MSRRQAEKPMEIGDVTKILVGGIFTGLALAIGGEAWQWISPMKRRERALEREGSMFDEDEIEIEEVGG